MPDSSNKSGQFPSIGEDFKIVGRIGIGGMGAVYEAVQLKLDRKVAVKVLADRLASDPEFLERFQREARAAAMVNHPNLVQIFDFGEHQGLHYSVLEYIEGENLGERLKRAGPMSLQEALEVVSKVASALNAAWNKKRIIHRDIKPENVMITIDGQVKLADLGLAKILGEESNMTMTGMGLGSPHYMAPEQASDAKDVDFRSDMYSLGVTLLSLVTGKKVFKGNSPYALIKAHAEQPLPSGADLGFPLPDGVEMMIQRMAAKRPEERFSSYEELLGVMGELMTDTDATITIPPRVQPEGAPSFSNAPTAYTDATDISYAETGASAGAGPNHAAPKKNHALYAIVAVTFAAVAYLLFDTFSPPRQQAQSTAPEPGGPTNAATPQVSPDAALDDFLFGNENLADRNQPPQQSGFDRSGGPRPPPEFMIGLVRPSHEQWHYPIDLPHVGRPSDRPLSGSAFEQLKQQAADFAKKNPQQYRDIFNAYEQVWYAADAARRSEVESLVRKQLESYRADLNKAIGEYTIKMDSFAQQGDMTSARDVWRQFPTRLITFRATDLIWQAVTNTLPAAEVQKMIAERPMYQGHPGGRGPGF